MNAEAMLQLMRDGGQEAVVGLRVWAHQMHGQRGLRRAHAPDMEVMRLADARQAGQIGLDRRGIDALRHGVEREVVKGSPAEGSPAEGSPALLQSETLDVVGTFTAPGQHLGLSSGRFNVEEFPPAELFEAAGSECFVSLFPVQSTTRSWGFLAVADPMNRSFVGRDSNFTWPALFSEALEHRALMRSYSQRSEDLARSYDREREMATVARESEQRYALAAQAANDGLWDWDIDAGTVYYSPRWKEVLGYPGPAIGDRPEEWLDRVHADDRAGLLSDLSDMRAGRRQSMMSEHRVRAHDGDYRWALCRCLAVPGLGAPATRIVGSLTDVTERHMLEERLRHQALYDDLTGLPNRALFLDRLSQAVSKAKRQPECSYSVLWLDIDNFKNLNDSLGHQVGDKLLVVVAERLRAQLRKADTAARFGGDEFAMLLLEVPDFAAVQCAVERLLRSLRAPYRIDGHEIVVTGSVGVTTSANCYETPEEVLRDADIAMYRAKSTARGTYATFDTSMYASALARLESEAELLRSADALRAGRT